jgi:cyclopropane-fatty-acyl-phospholipid synthase
MKPIIASLAKKMFLSTLEGIQAGSLELVTPGQTLVFGDPSAELRATLVVESDRFFSRALTGGETAIGEAYMDGDWSTPDLVSLMRLAVRNTAQMEAGNTFISSISRIADRIRQRLRKNTVAGSSRNIQEHYDLSNDLFRLFLDHNMLYSCAWYETPKDSLETAQFQKIDRICRKLDLQPQDHVLEIGTGWGAFALHAARHYGCTVTTTTISQKQYEYARERFAAEDRDHRIELLQQDYRQLQGKFSKIVSIEMFEAVGFEHYDDFFGACDRLLKPDGSMLLQTITMNEQRFPQYVKQSDWIQKYIFPGGQLASVRGILDSVVRSTDLSLFHAEDMGAHYARTLAEWRKRFFDSLALVKELGFGERFIRMWDYYLGFCEAAFRERHIGVMQLLLTKNHNPNPLFQEPWRLGKESVGQETLA